MPIFKIKSSNEKKETRKKEKKNERKWKEKYLLSSREQRFFYPQGRARRLILTWKLFLSAVVRDGQEIGPAGLRAERGGTKATNTPEEYRGRRVTESPRRARAIYFAITGNTMDFASCYHNQRRGEYVKQKRLNPRSALCARPQMQGSFLPTRT